MNRGPPKLSKIMVSSLTPARLKGALAPRYGVPAVTENEGETEIAMKSVGKRLVDTVT